MSLRVKADADKLEQYAKENADLIHGIADSAKSVGCIHHTFAAENGDVVVMDEWRARRPSRSSSTATRTWRRSCPTWESSPRRRSTSTVRSTPRVSFELALARMCLLSPAAPGALLVRAPSAWAGGTWTSKSDYTNLHVNWS